jgi:hypothetical protein
VVRFLKLIKESLRNLCKNTLISTIYRGQFRRRDLQKSTPINVIGVYFGCFYAKKQPKCGYSGYIWGSIVFQNCKKKQISVDF